MIATTSQARPDSDGADVDIEPPGCSVLVVGCGNLLRGDDGVGPILVRHLWERGVPDGARLVDGGTAGMDVAFQMRGAARVVIVDAAATGAAPGTVYRVPGAELEDLPPLQGCTRTRFVGITQLRSRGGHLVTTVPPTSRSSSSRWRGRARC